ncbi:hypothetical protein MBT84_22180 [Streptomyces sp. MBT84]|nr:hypothetical protein [Streptomyces sp. MBT84]
MGTRLSVCACISRRGRRNAQLRAFAVSLILRRESSAVDLNVVQECITYNFGTHPAPPTARATMVPVMKKAHPAASGFPTRAAEVGMEPWRS